jgi:hypothetical protein
MKKTKIKGWLYGLIFSLMIGAIMSFFMSFATMLIFEGFIENYMMEGLKRSVFGFVISAPIALIAVPLIQKFMEKRFEIV